MSRKKRVIAVMMVIALICGLTACGKKIEGTKTDQGDVVAETKDAAGTDSGSSTAEKADDKADASSEPVSDVPVVTEPEEEPEKPEQPTTLNVYIGEYADWYFDEDASALLAHMGYERAQLGENEANWYPELAASIADMSDELATATTDSYEYLIDIAKDDYQFDSEYFWEHNANSQLSVLRADTSAVSFLQFGDSYSGGVHANYYLSSYNFDTETGKKLELGDVVTDKDAFINLIAEELKEKYPEELEYCYDSVSEVVNSDDYGLTWVVTYEGVDVYFSPYEIASFAAGILTCGVRFADHPEIFTTKYTVVPDHYTISFCGDGTLRYDFNGDGKSDDISFFKLYEYDSDDYEGSHEFVMYMNDDTVVDDKEYYSFDSDIVVVHTASGNNYLLVDNTSENDYHTLALYSPMDGSSVPAKVYGTGFSGLYDAFDEYYTLRMFDSNNFPADVRLDTLCTTTGEMYYSVGDGYFERLSDIYQINSGVALQSAKGLTCDTCDVYGNVTGSIDVKPANYYELLATDNETFVIARLEDGTLVKLYIDMSDWPYTVNGESEEDVFPNAVFAG